MKKSVVNRRGKSGGAILGSRRAVTKDIPAATLQFDLSERRALRRATDLIRDQMINQDVMVAYGFNEQVWGAFCSAHNKIIRNTKRLR